MKNKMEQIEYQDYEWANDWKVIVDIFDTIDKAIVQFKLEFKK